MATVKVGDTIESHFGRGEIIAITKEWLVHDTDEGEAAINIEGTEFWIPVTETEQGGGQEGRVKATEGAPSEEVDVE